MPRKPRDYAAEYQRSVARAAARGTTLHQERMKRELRRAEREGTAPSLERARGHHPKEKPVRNKPVLRGTLAKVAEGSQLTARALNPVSRAHVSHTWSLADPNVQAVLRENGIHLPQRLPIQTWKAPEPGNNGVAPNTDIVMAAEMLFEKWFNSAENAETIGGSAVIEPSFVVEYYHIWNKSLSDAIRKGKGQQQLRRIYQVK